jgi:cobalt-zinc-cadmium efflux system membrane fusion protein
MNKIIIILLVFVFAACGKKTEETQSAQPGKAQNGLLTLTQAQLKSANVVSAIAEEREISTIIKLNGKIDVPPQNMVSVSMPLGGYLKTTKLLPGMHVRKGEVIATLEDQQYIQLQQDYLNTKSQLEFAEAEYKRQLELNKSKASSDKVFQQALLEFQTHKVSLSALSERLKLINIQAKNLNEGNLSKSVNLYSPIDGFVSKVNVNIGKYVTPADILFELVNPADIHLNLNVFEKDLNRLAIGQKLMAYTNHQPDNKHACEIILISKNLSDERIAEVHCHFENYDKTLLPGMYMNADIELKSNKALTVADASIVNSEGKNYVFISLGNNQFKMVEVETGVSEKGFTEIINRDAIVSKQIVSQGAYTLLMALKNTEEE